MTKNGLVAGNTYLEPARQMGAKEILAIIIRRRWVILGVVVPIFLLAFLATLRSSSTVTASTRVILETQGPESPSFGSQKVDYDVLMSTASQVVISIPVADMAAEALWDSIPSLMEYFPDFALLQNEGELRDLVFESVDCNQVGETNILEISVTHPSARFSMAAVSAITTAYMEYNILRQRNQPAVQYYSDQIDNVMAEIDSLQEVRASILEEFGLIAFDKSAQSNTAQIVEIERQYFTEQAHRKSLETMLSSIKEVSELEPRFFPQSEDMNGQELFVINRMLDEEETQLTKLRQQYQDDSEWVKRQEAVVNELREKFSKARANLISDMQIQLDISRSKEAAYKTAIDQQRQRAALYPEVNRQLSSVDVNIETQMDLLELLQTKRGEVRLKAASDYRISNIIPLNQPSISGFVGGSKRAIYLILATMFGLVLGLILALFLDNQDHRIYNKFELQEHLEIPVLGAITKAQGK